jgi:membrane-bound serine protease (ClpP class)
MALTLVIALWMIKSLPRVTTWNRLVLGAEERSDAGYRAVSKYDDLLDATGTSFTPLRPGGTGLIDGRRISVATEGDFIDKDTPIKVVEVEGNRIIVRRTDPA